jgi:hypothetical protein
VEKNVVYHKTPKGSEAIATRQHGLTPKLRSMLILVDGKRSFDDLEPLSRMLGDTVALMQDLLERGLIEPGQAAPAKHTDSKPAPLAPSISAASLLEAQRFAVRRLTDLLGPNADEPCLRIEAAKSLHDLQVALARADGLLRQFRSGHVADEYMAEVKAHLPAG